MIRVVSDRTRMRSGMSFSIFRRARGGGGGGGGQLEAG